MSAIGSVIVMWIFFLATVPERAYREGVWVVQLPGRFGDAGQLAGVCHFSEADPAKAELLVDRVRAAATLAAGVTPYRELRLALGLHAQCCLSHI
jgi:hypothetical protein